MPCCGQNREQAKTAAPTRATPQAQVSQAFRPQIVKPASAPVLVGPMGRIRYTGVAEISVRGAQSGRAYVFSAKNPERMIPKSDIDGLLRVGLFRRV
jgi:hypothetical protein